jgi:hypothetical protein
MVPQHYSSNYTSPLPCKKQQYFPVQEATLDNVVVTPTCNEVDTPLQTSFNDEHADELDCDGANILQLLQWLFLHGRK